MLVKMTAVIAAVVASLALAAPASADPMSHMVCSALDDSPTVATVMNVGLVLMDNGYTAEGAAYVVVVSVQGDCPWHTRLLQRTARYGTSAI